MFGVSSGVVASLMVLMARSVSGISSGTVTSMSFISWFCGGS